MHSILVFTLSELFPFRPILYNQAIMCSHEKFKRTVASWYIKRMDHMLGLDIGGTGIKAAIVNVNSGKLLTERLKVLTPLPATPAAIVEVVKDIVLKFGWEGPIGCGFPAQIKKGVCLTANNIDESWIGIHLEEFFENAIGNKFCILNDADAAVVAELRYGALKNFDGRAIMLTIGTGIGSALVEAGTIIKGLELGSMFMSNGVMLEEFASNKTRKEEELDWEQWAMRLKQVLAYLENILNPDLFIIGGGISKKTKAYEEYLKDSPPYKPALLHNAAGVIGGAAYAYKCLSKSVN